MADIPYWRLSAFYFFYFSLLGCYIPYWTLYLQAQAFDAVQIGTISGLMMATKIIAPNLWGALADRRGQRLRVVRLGSALALLCFSGIFLSRDYWPVLLVVAGFSFFWNAVLPQFEVLTLGHLGVQYNRYSQVRVWGSVGFIAAVLLLGALLDRLSIAILPLVMVGALSAIWLCSLWVPDARLLARERAPDDGFLPMLRRPPVLAFFCVCLLMQVSHGPYYTFFSIYLLELDYSRALIGQLWSLGVVAEVLLFLVMHRLLPRFGLRRVMLVCLLLSALRWLMIGYGGGSLPVLLIAQCLHAATFGAFHSVSIELVRRHFPAASAGQGQAAYSAVSFGLGGAIGAIASGYLWEYSHLQTFVLASAASMLAFGLAWCFIREPREAMDVT